MNRLILAEPPYAGSPPPFAGMDSWEGDRMVPPVAVPPPGIESLSAIERAADAGVLRDADAEARQVYSDARPRPLRLDPGTPPELRPPGYPRQARHPLSNWPEDHWLTHLNPHQIGVHGEIEQGTSLVSHGTQQPGISLRRNTHRLAPEPWDTDLYLAPEYLSPRSASSER